MNKCTCGAHKVYGSSIPIKSHSDWCDMHEKILHKEYLENLRDYKFPEYYIKCENIPKSTFKYYDFQIEPINCLPANSKEGDFCIFNGSLYYFSKNGWVKREAEI